MMKFIRLISTLCCFACNSFADNVFINRYVFEWGDKNPKVVENYLRSSIEQNPVSAYVLGNLYLFGIFLPKDLQKADWYITKAANMNLPEAINSIGDGYYTGDIRPKNIKMALQYYKKAAKMGFGIAQFNAGIVLLETAKTKNELRLAIFYLDNASQNRNNLKEIAEAANKYMRDANKKLKYYK
ncbi:MAG: sel1 repeat family protein [Alphaproteobacteria bacterium]|nr:sel1 repeat family protein [Alphaproteobacteria bacterium]MBQ3944429.1 sel1 repeat family protein [Alphaproteobacteria bacterium]